LLAIQRPYLTFWHWSSVTPYTSSYEFAGSCVFGKQSPGRLSLRPILRWAGLIPKVRPLFCRVPWSTLTRSPCSTRAAHLCRFAVRSYCWYSLEVFLGRLFTIVHTSEPVCAPLRCKHPADLPTGQCYDHGRQSNKTPSFISSVPPSPNSRCRNINLLSIGCGFRHSLRPD
jgi:hypothetical protein